VSDERFRELERAAAAGDPDALGEYVSQAVSRGLPVDPAAILPLIRGATVYALVEHELEEEFDPARVTVYATREEARAEADRLLINSAVEILEREGFPGGENWDKYLEVAFEGDFEVVDRVCEVIPRFGWDEDGNFLYSKSDVLRLELIELVEFELGRFYEIQETRFQ